MGASQRRPREDPGVLAGRIVEAARSSFAELGWAGTTMRGVARSAGVDPALVHYYFASKEQLLDAAMVPPDRWLESAAQSVSGPIGDRGEAIVRAMSWAWQDPEVSQVLRSILLTAAHVPQARERLRVAITAALVASTAEHLDGEERHLRAGLAASQVIGVALMRHLWEVEPLASLSEDRLVELVAPAVQRHLTGPLP